MNTVKNTIIASTLALVGLFSSVAEARISGDQIEPMTKDFLVATVGDSKTPFQQCVRANFLDAKQGQRPPLLDKLYNTILEVASAGLIEDRDALYIVADSVVKGHCGDSQLAGNKKSK